MSCFKTAVDLYAKLHAPSLDHQPFAANDTRAIIHTPVSIHACPNVYANLGYKSPEVSDTPLELPQGSLSTQETIYEFEPSPPPTTTTQSTTSLQRLKRNDNGLISPLDIDDLCHPLVKGFTPPPRPESFVSAAIAFGATSTTTKLIASDKALYNLFDGIFERVASLNDTMKDISEDITTFTKYLTAVEDGLKILEGSPRDAVQSIFNCNVEQKRPVWDDTTVRKWFRDLLDTTPYTSKAWRDMVLLERRIFEMSLLELKGFFDARLCSCESILEKLHEDIVVARDPLVNKGEKHGRRFGEPWLEWAWSGTQSMKRYVNRFERFSAGKDYEKVW